MIISLSIKDEGCGVGNLTMAHSARRYQVDGFRFDLMGHIPLKVMRKAAAVAARDALNIILIIYDYVIFIIYMVL